MPVETPVTFIHSLNSANPLDTDFASDGDNHIRNIKAAVKATFPNINAAVNPTPAELNKLAGLATTAVELGRIAGVTSPVQTQINGLAAGLPAGIISMWSGSVVSIPAGWKLCDGTLSTPDLRGRFIVGAGDTYSPGNTGGVESNTAVPAHTHGHTLVVDSGGSHTHGITDPGHIHGFTDEGPDLVGTNNISSGSSDFVDQENIAKNTASATTGISINSGGAHTHTLSGAISSTGAASVENRPPYYALCYIMKT